MPAPVSMRKPRVHGEEDPGGLGLPAAPVGPGAPVSPGALAARLPVPAVAPGAGRELGAGLLGEVRDHVEQAAQVALL
ncbi:hypothetical protein RB200_13530 [Streptomyces sp. PmtG]